MPTVDILFLPPEGFNNTALVPPIALGMIIMEEAASIVHYYSTLQNSDFQGNPFPVIGDPLVLGGLKSHHVDASMTLAKLMERIQHPPPNYPTIHGLKSGSYICTVVQHFAHTVVEIVLSKA